MGTLIETADNSSKNVGITAQQEKDSPSSVSRFTDDFIFLKIGTSFKKIQLRDIDYIVYADRYPNLVIEHKQFPLNVTMKELAKNLPNSRFIQIHQSYIVNLHKVVQINMVENQVDIVERLLPIGISFKKALQTRLTFLT